jgi:hypothetical protein
VADIPWFHNVILIGKVKDPTQRLRYAAKTLEYGRIRGSEPSGSMLSNSRVNIADALEAVRQFDQLASEAGAITARENDACR